MFPIIGFLLLIGFLFAVLVLCGIVWALGNLALGISYVIHGPSKNAKVTGVRPSPTPVRRRDPVSGPPYGAPAVPDRPRQAPGQVTSEIWPKWTPAHRRYVNEELALWQEQFDALDSRQ